MEPLCFTLVLLLALSVVDPGESESRRPPLWVFSLPEDIEPIFSGLTEPFILVNNGTVLELISRPNQVAANLVALTERTVEFPVVICIRSKEFEEAQFAITLTSPQPEVLTGALSVPSSGVITSRPYRLRTIFNCSTSSNGEPIILEVSFNISRGSEIFSPVNLYVGKRCGDPGTPTISIGGTDGFLNQNFSFKELPTTELPIVITASANTQLTVTLPAVLIPLVLVTLVTLLVLFTVWGVWYRRKNKEMREWQPEAVSMAYQGVHTQWIKRGPHEKEIPREKVHLVRELGEGAFGVVYQAAAESIDTPESGKFTSTDVAVKQLREGSGEVDDFFREVDFMSKLDHPNIVKLIGVCSVDEPFCMIFEYMDLGDLCNFLRQAIGLEESQEELQEEDGASGVEPLLTQSELLTIAAQVAEGMVYISSLGLVHRDLASRNCLVATGLVVKIGDFGMSRSVNDSDYYRVKGNALLPVRWMPPESILYGKFTMETDVWAFGILLWEIFTFGQQPYSGLANEEVVQIIQKGGHPEPPDSCPALKLMLQCWDKNPKKRLPFSAITTALHELNGTTSENTF